MRYQSTPARCGPAALREALRALGTTRSEDELAALAKTTTEGTRVGGLVKAARAVLPALDPKTFNDRPDVAVLRLLACLRAGVPVVPCLDANDHWVAAVGLFGLQSVLIADPAHEELYLYTEPDALLARWVHNKKCFSLVLL